MFQRIKQEFSYDQEPTIVLLNLIQRINFSSRLTKYFKQQQSMKLPWNCECRGYPKVNKK